MNELDIIIRSSGWGSAIWAIGCEIAWYGGTFSGRSQAIVASVLSQAEVMWEIPQSPGLTHVKNLQMQGNNRLALVWFEQITSRPCLRFRCQQSGTHAVVREAPFWNTGHSNRLARMVCALLSSIRQCLKNKQAEKKKWGKKKCPFDTEEGGWGVKSYFGNAHKYGPLFKKGLPLGRYPTLLLFCLLVW